jgi:Bacteriophage HK97-gp10, putative tail-component
MANVTFEGLDELKEQLRHLPAALTGEAANVIQATANRAEADMRARYSAHVRSGNLRDGLEQIERDERSANGYAIMMINRARHAWIFEFGTQARHRGIVTWAPMPAGHVFIPAMDSNRRWMYEQLKDVLRRAGLEVSGDF